MKYAILRKSITTGHTGHKPSNNTLGTFERNYDQTVRTFDRELFT